MTTAVQLAQSVAPGVSLGFKNRIINGNMTIDQRNAGASVTITSSTYTLDRWQAIAHQSSKYSVQQNAASVTPPAGYKYYLGVTSLSAYTVGSTEVFVIRQPIEGFNVYDLAWGTASAAAVTLSFWVRSSLTGTFGGSVNQGSTYSYPFTYTISAANTWEQKTVTIPGSTAGTWNSTNSTGFYINFGLGCGASVSGTAGSWQSTDYYSATGATSVVGTNGATFYITGVQLEVGTTATPFEFRDYGRELIMCQRYYETMNVIGNQQAWVTGTCSATDTFFFNFIFRVNKRASPTVAFANTSNWQLYSAGGYRTVTGSLIDTTTISNSAAYHTTGSGVLGSGNAGITRYTGTGISLYADAEL